jgi:hypothetical protein
METPKSQTKFYLFDQNNSFGRTEREPEKGIGDKVFIEAINPDSANWIAEQKGLYFDGCSQGIDCHCCGDRWNRTGEYDAQNTASDVTNYISESKYFSDDEAYIHYLNGRIEKIVVTK